MNLKSFLIIPPLAIGVLGFMWMTQPDDTTSAPKEEVRLAVRTLTVMPEQLTLSATGFGRVEPVQSWSAVSQAEGRIVETYPSLAVGTVVNQGDLLAQIDPTDYELTIAKTEANIAAAEATLAELTQQEENTRRLLEVEQRVFEVAQAEFARTQTLSEAGTVTSAAFDTAQKSLLAQENAVTSLTNTLALYPTQRASAEATLSVRQAELAEAERGLANTLITAPFRGRVAAKAVETGQFVRVGNDLLTLDAISEAEVVGAFQPQDFANLMRGMVGPQFENVTDIDSTRVIEYMNEGGVSAFLELDYNGGPVVRYPAEATRFRGTIDNETGTLGIAVRIDDPFVANAQQARPPLEFGSFVSVVLEGQPQSAVISVPRDILQQSDAGQPYVYTANAEDRLAITPVTPDAIAGDRVLISQGLSEGDRVLLSAPRPAIPGLALTVLPAGETNQ